MSPDVPFARRVDNPAPPFGGADGRGQAPTVDNTAALMTDTGGEFAGEVAAATDRWEEQFIDVTITPAADLAVLDARYTFAINGAITNRGREVWILIATPRGWKIASVTWTAARAVAVE